MFNMLYAIQAGMVILKLIDNNSYSWFKTFIPMYIIIAIYVLATIVCMSIDKKIIKK